MKDAGEDLGIPDLGPGQYLMDVLFEVGPTVRTPIGEYSLDWPNLAAYAQATGTIKDPWEFKTLRSMSAGYMEGRHFGMDGLSLPPAEWETE